MSTRPIGDEQKSANKIEEQISPLVPNADVRKSSGAESNHLSELGQKIFLDRYAMKDIRKRTLSVGDLVIVCVDTKTGQREIGTVTAMDETAAGGAGRVTVELRDGARIECLSEHVSKPIETEPEQMMERVARGIAAVEGERADEWYHNFRWLLNGWKFVPAGRILTAAGTDQQLTFYNCLPPEQEILTAEGYKPIAEVKVGDYVVTHRNRLRRVLNKFERETEEPIYIIKAKKIGYDDLRVTGEHKILAIRSEWVNAHKSRDGLKLQQEPQWISARELKPGDYLAAAYDGEQESVTPIYLSEYVAGYQISNGKLFKPQLRSDNHGYLEEGGTRYSVNDQLVVDRELCYLFGRWLGDGCVTHRTKTDIPSGIKIVFALDEREEAERIARIIEDKFGVPTSIKMSSTERWLDLWANSMPLGQFFKAFFGCYSYGKRIPAKLMRLPNELSLELLKGLFSADGYASDNKLGILLSNRTLATQVHQMLLRLGYFFSIKETTHRLGRRPAYRIQATANECAALFKDFFNREAPQVGIDTKFYFQHDGLRWVRIGEIVVEGYSGMVFDIEVEEDHSFVSAGVVVSNCYVIPSPKDSRRGIVDTLSQMMEIMSRGGGVGINVSSLRPRHSYVKGVNGRSSGSVSWGALYSFVTGLIEQGGSRRGALMLILNCWHPDVLEFINAKRDMGKITNANISVGITDKFMDAVHADADWDLIFPDTSDPDYETMWDGNLDKWLAADKPVVVHKTVKAREIWNSIIESAWASAEPGVFFIERANKMSNSWYYDAGYLGCTNPCGEQPLPGYGVCNLGAINLSKFVRDGDVAWDDLGKAVRYSVRFLDNVIDATPYFFDENYAQQKAERRVGLNTMGLAEMLIRLGIRYGSEESVQFIDRLYRFISSEAYHASADIAAEKGPFPMFDAEKFLQSGYMQAMPEDVREAVRQKGMRNVTLLTQAPNGTTGTLVGTSTGIEPFYFWSYLRKSRLGKHEERVKVYEEWQQANPNSSLPSYFVTAMDLAPEEHVKVQAAIQRWIDSSISKTCNLPASYTIDQTREIYELLYRLGCKGGTIYRDGSRDVQVLNLKEEDKKVSEAPRAESQAATQSNESAPAQSTPAVSEAVAVATPSSEMVRADGEWQPKVRPRPYKRRGYTVSKATPSGTAHITMNEDEEGQPFEVFVEIGKAGSDIKAMAEAMGRLMSLTLRMASPVSPVERIREIVKQITGIGGARSYGFGKRRVMSLPDAVGQALAENYLNVSYGSEEDGQGAEMGVEVAPVAAEHKSKSAIPSSAADLCPSCGDSAFVRTEGCHTCFACGYSEC